MKRFQSILAQLDTSHSMQPVLDAAAVLADRHRAKLTLADVVPEFTWPARITMPDADQMRGLLADQKRRRLAELAEPLAARGLDVQTRVLMGRTSTRLIEEIETSGHDLLVRVTKGVHSRRPGYLGTTGLKLLRHCPCPVWLIKPEQAAKPTRIVAAVDVGSSDEAHQRLNGRILELASTFAEVGPCPFDVLFAWTIYGENILREHLRPEEFEELQRSAEADHQKALEDLLRKEGTQLPRERIHLVRGDASHEIPRFVQTQRVDLLVMGTVARRGAAGWLLGNTAERVFDKVNCSLLATKPEDDRSP